MTSNARVPAVCRWCGDVPVVGEIRKQASWLDEPVTLGHWRTSDGAEVDLVMEYDDGTVVAFEVMPIDRMWTPVATDDAH